MRDKTQFFGGKKLLRYPVAVKYGRGITAQRIDSDDLGMFPFAEYRDRISVRVLFSDDLSRAVDERTCGVHYVQSFFRGKFERFLRRSVRTYYDGAFVYFPDTADGVYTSFGKSADDPCIMYEFPVCVNRRRIFDSRDAQRALHAVTETEMTCSNNLQFFSLGASPPDLRARFSAFAAALAARFAAFMRFFSSLNSFLYVPAAIIPPRYVFALSSASRTALPKEAMVSAEILPSGGYIGGPT